MRMRVVAIPARPAAAQRFDASLRSVTNTGEDSRLYAAGLREAPSAGSLARSFVFLFGRCCAHAARNRNRKQISSLTYRIR
jgi:hypothetical protein